MQTHALHVTQLTGFFDGLNRLKAQPKGAVALTTKLQSFFTQITPLLRNLRPTKLTPEINVDQLHLWFNALKAPIDRAKQGAFSFNPWITANVKRDEVRNSAILAWLLNPKGNHGLGKLALKVLTGGVSNSDLTLNIADSRYCTVRTESNPDGSRTNRVDIEIDAELFYLLIEVKIDAPEGVDQLSRYGALCEKRAHGRPWAIIFLTPNKSPPKTAGAHENKITTISWAQLSHWISKELRQHISAQQGESVERQEILAQECVKHFLSYIRNF
ncbi:PDDEXK-like family protein [Deefgea salmonis]|uniref:PD-(D/E)XK nuclease family protein n=1 Tax=Deefgea salmonis TaxID=2875502 RepID=A0ABS8BIY2_9NEIS|nr:PD-(D/E)XK nuclease family protein [Deefgea salmonis]MCB5195693.1 PD-(D/E)XK nuclease family protein [Deefgea salmonis]